MDDEIENVRVIVRVRPLNKRELEIGCKNIIQIDEQNQRILVEKSGQNGQNSDLLKSYKFDYVLKEDSSQMDVYYKTTRSIVDKVLEGYNGTVLAYGQTGTGKTYTMSGESYSVKDQRGIIPNTFGHIFSHIANAEEELTFLVHVTYLEIYNENVRDLLVEPNTNSNTSLEVREHCDYGVFVQNLSGYIVNTIDELERLMDIGDKNRAVGATGLNFASSRSHTIFTITLESNNKHLDDGKYVTRGKLHLVDLAGSERQSKTNATGLRLKEATKINQSLSVLGNVISALVDGKSTHIPYRNSKLTRLLQDALGGNSKTVMITTISPSQYDYEETISTLRYANRAKNIQNHTHINEQPKDTLLRSFQSEIEELRRQLEAPNISSNSISLSSTNVTKTKERTRKKEKKSETEIMHSEQDDELYKTRLEQGKVREKLDQLTNKIIVGGVNLLQKAEDQEFLLEMTKEQLEESAKFQEHLEQTLQQREAERIDFKERYSTLQEEVIGKTKKLKKLAVLINDTKIELADQQQEYQREIEVLLDTVRGLTRELQLAELITNAYIPKEYQTIIEKYIHWNEDIGEYQLKCVAYTGNNMRKRHVDTHVTNDLEHTMANQYLQYTNTGRKTKKSSNVPRFSRTH